MDGRFEASFGLKVRSYSFYIVSSENNVWHSGLPAAARPSGQVDWKPDTSAVQVCRD